MATDSGTPPPSELGPSGPVTDTEVLAAVARAERHEAGVSVREIANHLGWRYNGSATVRLRPHLGRLASARLLDSTEPPPRKSRWRQWKVAGRRRLAAAGPVALPESPQHRRWRHDRDIAAWAMPGVRERAGRIVEEARGLLREIQDGRPATEREIERIVRRFERSMKALGLASRMCDGWPEPSEESHDRVPGHVYLLLPDLSERPPKRRS
jgi:hypothetical protein